MSQPMPPSATAWNNFFNLAAYIAVTAVIIVMAAMVYFVIKYRQRKGQPNPLPQIGLPKGRAREALIFASISVILLFSLTIASFTLTPNARFPPPVSESLVIRVTCYQWAFRFTYPNGVNITGTCYVPENKSIIFNVTSTDVMHGFGLMDFRVKIEAIPGRYNVIGITTPSLNENSELNYTIRCFEYCGVGHTTMMASLIVMNPTAFNQWLSNQTITNPTMPGG